MKMPKYIVFRVDVMKKGTSVELTNITDDVEDVILKSEQTDSNADQHAQRVESIEMTQTDCPYGEGERDERTVRWSIEALKTLLEENDPQTEQTDCPWK